ncbi:3-oxoacyl-ACP reductase FabG [Roseospirillum parvum]|uniref:Acetoacetyl-CoA reductase n=1 Tax=Roseospirillum parvum TaxID=83401 RepID=A0A1G8CW36_9PROT|nr:3-oxoacyl-ACP reductase FabG [Roseospirillum parvum]SDH49695.1 acetoacetyl-CoA reductase [Roseospirillum parvum]
MSEQKIALVTGGARGIGAAIADALEADGHKVVIADIDQAKLAEAAQATGRPAHRLDISDFDNVSEVVANIESEVGPISILVNNAGITRDGFMHKMKPESWNAVINVNLTGAFNTCRVVAPGMRERGYGRIINISSMNGQRGQFGQCNYAAAKAGLLGFTRSIAQELAGKGITVNAVCPGFIKTDMTAAMPEEILQAEQAKIPVARLGEPVDIADMVAFLARPQSSFINGATLSVNGGQYMD